jgi:ATP-dependent 26S proteasome regulatory subunit
VERKFLFDLLLFFKHAFFLFAKSDIKAICTEAGLLALRERRMKV